MASVNKIYSKKKFPELHKLTPRKKNFVWLYLNPRYKEPETGFNTFNDAFMSYLVAYKILNRDENAEEKDFMQAVHYERDPKSGMLIPTHSYHTADKTEIQVNNAKLYEKHLKKAQRLEKECQEAINEIRLEDFKENQEDKQMELIHNIHNDAIYHNNLRYKTQNRKMAMDIYGLKNREPDTQVNIYDQMGKRIIKTIKQSKDDNTEMGDIVVDDDELEKYEEE